MVMLHCIKGRAMLKARRVVACFARVWPEPHLEQLLLEGMRIRRHQPLQGGKALCQHLLENASTGYDQRQHHELLRGP